MIATKTPKKILRPRLYHDPKLAKLYPNEMILAMYEVLTAINNHRWLANKQLHDLLYRRLPSDLSAEHRAKSDAATARAFNHRSLIRLKDRELIVRKAIHLNASGPWMPPYPINVLTQAGLDELRGHASSEGITDFQPRPLVAKIPFRSLDHEFKVRDVAIQFERAADEQGWYFGYWIGDEDFEMWKGHFSGQMIPDGFFLLQDGPTRKPHFLEVDMGTETVTSGTNGKRTIKDWATKFERYLNYLPRFSNDGIFQGLSDPIVLIVCPSGARMASLRKAAMDAGCRGMFWFTTFENLAHDWPMSALNFVWSTPHEKLTRSLLNRVSSGAPS